MRPRDIALINALICYRRNMEFQVIRPHNLNLIIRNIDKDLRSSDNYRKAAHLAYMINSLDPFANANHQTSIFSALFFLKMKNEKLPRTTSVLEFEENLSQINSSAKLADLIRL